MIIRRGLRLVLLRQAVQVFVRCHLHLSGLLKVVDDVLPHFVVDAAAFADVFADQRPYAWDSLGVQRVALDLILIGDVVLNLLGQVQYLGLIFRVVFILRTCQRRDSATVLPGRRNVDDWLEDGLDGRILLL